MMEAHRVVRSLLWQQIGGLGLEHCTLSQSAGGEWSFAGVVALAMNETPAHVTFLSSGAQAPAFRRGESAVAYVCALLCSAVASWGAPRTTPLPSGWLRPGRPIA